MEQATGHGSEHVPRGDLHAHFPSFDKDCAGHERVLFTGVCVPTRSEEGIGKRLLCRKGSRVKSHDIVTGISDGVGSRILIGPDNRSPNFDGNKVWVKVVFPDPDGDGHSRPPRMGERLERCC